MIVVEGVICLFADHLRMVAHGEFLAAAHYLAESALLIVAGSAGVFAEIRPHPVVSENAPYLNKLSGRAALYFVMGLYIVSRKAEDAGGDFASWMDRLFGFYILGVAATGALFAFRLRGLPPALSEPALAREMHSTAQHPGLPPQGGAGPHPMSGGMMA
eukprot:CAMPEP_0203960548 /NCGR_PEP_ID=MMETSP0359-20131031/91219_1 /ASSEMBLY_ACC=CAM_ASM_000338 /TAXON_ID=268821 /ORGANISM="Scrippsiella Hangoei, Strain SHTV-5" /LENGTH=158 /DNA_ID=CAMNT_0050894943 /DNA_START=172 /DNA_END=648 /DNA_ORIENTATION=+